MVMDESTLLPIIIAILMISAVALNIAAYTRMHLTAEPRLRRQSDLKRSTWAIMLLVAASAGYFGYLFASGNVHTVVAGELYRSGQVSGAQLATLKDRYGIKTVINLRGRNIGHPWYDEERAAALALHIEHIDFRMSTKRQLPLIKALDLVRLMRHAAKPILIHCHGGADRTGLATALYLGGIKGTDEDTAEQQLSILYGHLNIPFISPAIAMDETWESYETVFGDE